MIGVIFRLKRWKIYVSYDQAVEGLPSDNRIGAGSMPAVNCDIISKDCPQITFDNDSSYSCLNLTLKPGLKEHIDY